MSWAPKGGPVTETYRLPIQETVRDLLADLFGRACAVTKQSKALAGRSVAVVADYVDDAGSVAALAVADVGFASRVGAALALVPSRVAEDAVKADDVPDNLLENTQEVLNITARLFNGASSPHVRLRTVYRTDEPLPEATARLLEACAVRKDYAVSIEGYGDGRLALLVA
jgi:hypothetical protein